MTPAATATKKEKPKKFEKEPLEFTWREFMWPLAFMLTMSMLGLRFPLAWLFLPIILLNRFKFDRYDLMIQLTIFLGGYSFMPKINGVAMVITAISVTAIIILRKPPILKKTLIAIAAYFIALIIFASTSYESMSVQLQGIYVYMAIMWLFVPFMCFSGRDFDIKKFFRKVYIYALIACIFYIIDSVILGGLFLVPADPSWGTFDIVSTFDNPYIQPLSFNFIRRWPPGLYILILLVYPTARLFKLRPWMWIVILGAVLVSRTFTFTIALIVGYIFCRGTGKQLVIYTVSFLVAGVALYFIDGMLPETTLEGNTDAVTKSSTLRIKSQVDQFIDLDPSKADEETLAALGTGRGAQIIPKLELLFSMHREWIGLGFLSRDLTTSTRYRIDNELYSNPEEADEVATGVESTPFQIMLDIGFLGLIVHLLFFAALWLIVRRLRNSAYFLSVMLIFMLMGISGFSGLIRIDGLLWTSIVYAAVILNDKRSLPGFDLPPIRRKAHQTLLS